MFLTGKIRVKAVIPEELSKLEDMAFNLWWSWNHEATELFREIDHELWERLQGNPVRFFQEVSQQNLLKKARDKSFLSRFSEVVERYDRYVEGADTWFMRNYPSRTGNSIAYFSAEYGLHEVLPIYSGGLGVLSADHCKSASDLGLPLTGIGLFYKQGYFNQRINREGWQETVFPNLNPSHLPLKPVHAKNGDRLYVDIDMPGRKLYVQVWLVQTGRVNIYLLDADIDMNNPMDRSLTSRLYGGDQETRIQQEIILGIGGVKTLRALGLNPDIYHMNEGHSAFLGLELIRRLEHEKGLTFDEAREVAASSLVFTTHTPVPAGNDVFPVYMMDKYFDKYREDLGIDRDTFLALGAKGSEHFDFNMTVLALNLAGARNGVSELHGAVSRNIFNNVWSGVPEAEVPIIHITNGIHTMSWLSASLRKIYDNNLGSDWQKLISEENTWEPIRNIPDKIIWDAHCKLKKRMIEHIDKKAKGQGLNSGLDPNALTIGFARRFATYKRADLIFRNLERITSILNDPERPVQIIFAGKAHPADRPAQEIIKSIHDLSLQENLQGRITLIENYNMELARHMVAGVDVWLNNPRRPLEASGTSGQKVCVNGVVNFSVLDGWWCEGYNGHNGWTIGDDTFYTNDHSQDNADSKSIYDTLENQIIPLYYERDESGTPGDWVKLMKESIVSNAWRFSTDRMVKDYAREMYLPMLERMDAMLSTNMDLARELATWKSFIRSRWHQVHIDLPTAGDKLEPHEAVSGEPIHLCVNVFLGEIPTEDVTVEAYYGISDKSGNIEKPFVQPMKYVGKNDDDSYRYEVDIALVDGGDYSYTFRVVPRNERLMDRFDVGLIKWVKEAAHS